MNAALEAVGSLQDVVLRQTVPARELTTFGVGADVPHLLEIGSTAACAQVLKILQEHGASWRVLGAGSNVVLPDSDLSDVIIRLGRGLNGAASSVGEALEPIEQVADKLAQSRLPAKLYVAGGSGLMSLSRLLTARGLSGLEFAAGIPASVGGAVAMNAGAHGGSMADVLREVHVVSALGEQVLNAKDLQLAYRACCLPEQSVVVGAVLELKRDSAEECLKRRRENLLYRKKTQPLHLPSAGSVFQNPSDDAAAGALLDRAGFKGRRKGGVEFSEMHANWLVRSGAEAKSSDVSDLVQSAIAAVREMCAAELKPEIRMW